jgi:hypothetical protein
MVVMVVLHLRYHFGRCYSVLITSTTIANCYLHAGFQLPTDNTHSDGEDEVDDDIPLSRLFQLGLAKQVSMFYYHCEPLINNKGNTIQYNAIWIEMFLSTLILQTHLVLF